MPEIKTLYDLVIKTHLPESILREALNYLFEINLIKEDFQDLQTTGRRIHISPKTDMVIQHHLNWRTKAMSHITLNNEDDLHFSAVYSFNQEDFKKIKTILLEAISKSEKVVTNSDQNMIAGLSFDFFAI